MNAEPVFTPGPWEIDDCGKWIDIWASDSRGCVAEMFSPDIMDCPQVRANAHLIAAAPDMYRALEAVIGEWREGYGLNCVEQVRAALSLARGEKQ